MMFLKIKGWYKNSWFENYRWLVVGLVIFLLSAVSSKFFRTDGGVSKYLTIIGTLFLAFPYMKTKNTRRKLCGVGYSECQQKKTLENILKKDMVYGMIGLIFLIIALSWEIGIDFLINSDFLINLIK